MDKTIDMAREAGWDDHHAEFDTRLDRLVALVRADERNRTWTQEHWTEYERSIAAAEREACAKVADYYSMHDQDTPADIAEAIRNRGNI